ncbi:hypothetical protein PCC7424_4826 [Gloeothece citriformis PCC 7424]|uniref:Uncharacterized protein n=1 Tax=Gloeothece citriformis (strain PCC 7424) TaxID=65393 RepID=B7KD62_GLOC7|nr:hypothetical protein [Gloeothece citriformis]ACK73183.1 hypothetical protein PCC7424_4826 [Gloeothece citriformis PCC 7424]
MESYNNAPLNNPPIGEPPNYEFSSTQERLIGDLAGKMKFVSYFFIAVGIIQIIAGFLQITYVEGISSIINGIIYLFIGWWTYRSGSSFGSVAKTRGHDIENLMDALKQLKNLYTLLFWLLIIALVIFAIFAIVSLFR